MFKFDLSSGHHHNFYMHPCMYEYFGFALSKPFCVFTSLPIRLSSAPFNFTKLLRKTRYFYNLYLGRICCYFSQLYPCDLFCLKSLLQRRIVFLRNKNRHGIQSNF